MFFAFSALANEILMLMRRNNPRLPMNKMSPYHITIANSNRM